MNRALWEKAVGDAWPLLAGLTVLVFGFQWLFVWLTGQISLPAMQRFLLEALPRQWESLSGVPFREVATPAGRLALAWVHPLVLLSAAVWAIARGSDAVSGELGRGTLELVLAQPIRRAELLVAQAAVIATGAVALPAAGWLGSWAGIHTVAEAAGIAPALFVPPAVNLFGLIMFLGAWTMLASACDRHRWRTIGLAGGFFAVQMVLQVAARMSPRLAWLGYGTFLSAYEPQVLVARPDEAWDLVLRYNGCLLSLGLLAFVAAMGAFCRRDLPAPV